MAASNVTVEVQEYLDKHKINTLFEVLCIVLFDVYVLSVYHRI